MRQAGISFLNRVSGGARPPSAGRPGYQPNIPMMYQRSIPVAPGGRGRLQQAQRLGFQVGNAVQNQMNQAYGGRAGWEGMTAQVQHSFPGQRAPAGGVMGVAPGGVGFGGGYGGAGGAGGGYGGVGGGGLVPGGGSGDLLGYYQQAFQQAQAANAERAEQVGQGYQDRYDRALQNLQGLGDQERADINRSYDALGSQTEQNLVSRGLTATSVAPQLQAGVTRERTQAINRLEDSLRRYRIGLDAQLSGDALQFQERIEDEYPPLDALLNLGQAYGASGYQQFYGGQGPVYASPQQLGYQFPGMGGYPGGAYGGGFGGYPQQGYYGGVPSTGGGATQNQERAQRQQRLRERAASEEARRAAILERRRRIPYDPYNDWYTSGPGAV